MFCALSQTLCLTEGIKRHLEAKCLRNFKKKKQQQQPTNKKRHKRFNLFQQVKRLLTKAIDQNVQNIELKKLLAYYFVSSSGNLHRRLCYFSKQC